MKQPMWDSKAVKAYETGQGVELVDEPYPHYVPSQKKTEWVGLTDEDEIDWEEGGNLKDLVKAIEAKLKEKNGY